MLNKIGEDEQISEAFLDYVNYSLDQNERVNINKTLLRFCQRICKMTSIIIGSKKIKISIGKPTKTPKNNIRKKLKNSKKILKNCQDSLDLIKNNGLEIEDFWNGKTNKLVVFSKI